MFIVNDKVELGMYYIRYYNCFSISTHLVDILKDEFDIYADVTASVTNDYYNYSFKVSENHPQFAEIEPYLPDPHPEEFDPHADPATDSVFLFHVPIYDSQELQAANWLSVSSSFSKVTTVNSMTLVKGLCVSRVTKRGIKMMRHSYVVGKHIVKNPVKWGNRFFATSLDTGGCELFCNFEAKNAMERAGLKGVEYEVVYKTATGVEMDNMFYMKAQNTLPNGAIVPVLDMDTYTCEQCGMHMLGYRNARGQFGIQADLIDDSLDFHISLPLFSGSVKDPSWISGSSRFIVSQRFYQLVKNLKMDRALIFEPISLV